MGYILVFMLGGILGFFLAGLMAAASRMDREAEVREIDRIRREVFDRPGGDAA